LADPEVLIWPGTAITEGWTRVAVADDTAVGFVPDGTAQTRFGPAPRLRLDVVDTRR
jgi:hypothetical protein